MRWQWRNVPIPDAYVVGLVIGGALQIFFSKTLFQLTWIGHFVGWPLLAAGIGLCIWSVYEVKEMNISNPNMLLKSGPYALSRNPMYVGWTFIYPGVSFILNSAWIILFLPIILVYIHFVDIQKEERFLNERFGEEYREYQMRVRRYF